MKKKPKAPPVATIAKGLSALRSFVDGQDKWGVRELAVALNMPPSTVHRLLARFLLEGFVSYDQAHQKYGVGFEFTRLAAAVMQRHDLTSAALPVMRDLTEKTGEGVWLALFDDKRQRVAYIAETRSTHALRYSAPIGRSMHPSESACGVAIMASLAEARNSGRAGTPRKRAAKPDDLAFAKAQGFAVMRAAEVDSAMMIAAAVRDAAGTPVGSLAIIVPLVRFGVGQEAILGSMVKQAAQRLSAQMGSKLLGGATVGSWKEGAEIISDLIRQNNPALSMTPALGGGVRNLEDIQAGLGAYAMTHASSVMDARLGRHQFKRPLEDLRTVMHLTELHLVIAVRSDMKVKRLADLAGLRISPGEQSYSGAQAFEDLLNSFAAAEGRRLALPTVFYLDYPEAKRQLDEHEIDAIIWMTTFSNPSLRELGASSSVRLITPDEATIRGMIARNPGYRAGKIPRNAFAKPLKADLATVSVPTALVCRADRSEQEVYEVSRTIYEQRAVMAQLSSAYSRLAPDFVLDGATAPIHPGAERFFRSIGVLPRYAEASKSGARAVTGSRKRTRAARELT
jgi:TRAP transporter TAXI family solute receptor